MITGHTKNNEQINEISEDFTISDGTTFTGDFITLGGTSTFITNNNYDEATVESFEFKETSDGNFIEIVKRQKPNPNITYTTFPHYEKPDRVWKEIYGIKRNESGKKKLQLIQKIDGTITPGHYVEEEIEFE